MSVGCAKSPQGRRLVRKSVPDGSSDFQRALDHFLSSSESDDGGLSNDEGGDSPVEDRVASVRNKATTKYKYVVGTEKNGQELDGSKEEIDDYDYNDNFEDCNENTKGQENSEQSKHSIKKRKKRQNSDSPKNPAIENETYPVYDYNNNIHKSICTCERLEACETLTYTDLELGQYSPRNAWETASRDEVLSPRGILISNQEEKSDFPESLKKKRRSPPLKLPSISAHLSKPELTPLSGMGINCSANIGDTKEFSNVLTDGTGTAAGNKKPSKFGVLLTKRRTNSETADSSTEPTSSDNCSCSPREDGKKIASQSVMVGSDKAGLKSSVIKDKNSSGHKKGTKRSSSLPGKDSSKTASSSPQRLLTSRNRSPNGYLRSSISMDSGGDIRTRSHSWSNGRCISQIRQGPVRPITKNSSLFPRTLASGPGGNQHSHLPHLSEVAAMKKLQNSSLNHVDTDFHDSFLSLRSHQPGCPLHLPATNDKKRPALNFTQTEEIHGDILEPHLLPEQRPRAASESHTSRRVTPQQHLLHLPRPRSNTMSEGGARNTPNSDLDHGVHVHWADEEQGLSLSTSVLLTSIRPRYEAVSNYIILIWHFCSGQL